MRNYSSKRHQRGDGDQRSRRESVGLPEAGYARVHLRYVITFGHQRKITRNINYVLYMYVCVY